MGNAVIHTPVRQASTAPAFKNEAPETLRAGTAALEAINEELGLAFDEWDMQYYTRLFAEQLGRDPTNVELFDIAQSNSEHRCSLRSELVVSTCSSACTVAEMRCAAPHQHRAGAVACGKLVRVVCVSCRKT